MRGIQILVRFLKSTRLAVVLLFFLTVLSLVGIFLPQIPYETAISPDGYGMWMENVAYSRLGDLAYILEPLGFFSIFRSVWFVGAATALMLNILTCTLTRGRSLRKECKETRIMRDPGFYEEGKFLLTLEAPLSVRRMDERVRRILEARRFSLKKEEGRGCICLAGDKHRYAPLGTLTLHLSLILLLVGILVGMLGGFQDESLIVVEGAAANIGHGTGLSVYLLSFIDEYWEDGTPKDYRSSVGLYKDGAKVKSGIIRVNHPMQYEGVRIHQGYFGPAVRLLISDADGNPVLKDHVALTEVRVNDSLQRPEGMVTLADDGYNIFILGSAVNGADPFIGSDQIGLEFYDADMNFLGWLLLDEDVPQQLLGLSFSYDSLQYAGFLVSKNPGAPILEASALLFLLGLGMIFYFPRRRLWVRISPVSENAARLTLKLEAKLEPGLEREALRIQKALRYMEKPEGSR